MTLFGFMDDEALYPTQTGLVAESTMDKVCGYFGESERNMFVDLLFVKDNRAGRLSIGSKTRLGKISLAFDGDKVANDDPLRSADVTQLQHIMNIIEHCIYTDAATADINTALIANAAEFGGYVPGTLTKSVATSTTEIKYDGEAAAGGPVNDWIQFTFNIGANNVEFKIWVNSDKFKEEYALSTIRSVIFPCTTEKLIDPDYVNEIDGVIKSASYVNTELSANVGQRDHTGALEYRTRYANNNLTAVYELPFTILYTGDEPSDLQIRQAIKTKLEATPGIAPEVWEELFPELYTSARIFLIPMWNNETIVGSDYIYPSIQPLDKVTAAIDAIFPDVDNSHKATTLDMLTSDCSKVAIIAMPDSSNSPVQTMRAIHPTYINVDGTNAAFSSQDEHTREVNVRISNGVRAAEKDINTSTSTFDTKIFGEREYLSFVINRIEYCILKKKSFPV